MNKKSKQVQKEESRERILNVSSRLFKTQGFHATGIDQIMLLAGLTAGAFYAHFKSKEDLFEQTLKHALNQAQLLLTKQAENLTGEEKNSAIFKRYCSLQHRDFPEKGCILPALAAEIHTASSSGKVFVADYIERWAQMIAEHLSDDLSDSEKKEKSLQLISRAVGAVLLSRMVHGHQLSENILEASQKI